MQEATQQPTILSAADPIAAAAFRAESWAGEPFLRDGEEPAVVLAPGTARRRALDDATAEIEAELPRPTSQWKVRYGLMLGLERVLADP
jgi:ribonuclease E